MITRGIGFRFKDVVSLFFRDRQARIERGAPSEPLSFCVSAVRGELNVPPLDFLPVNYRTHSGIMELCASITDVLTSWFPFTIDVLPRETALFHGPPPDLLVSTASQKKKRSTHFKHFDTFFVAIE